MILRGTIVFALVMAEFAILGAAGAALRGGWPPAPPAIPGFPVPPGFAVAAHDSRGGRILEDGPGKLFNAGTHPSLTVDIGYADLTILPSDAPNIDVSVRGSHDFGVFRARAPITAREEDGAIRVATGEEHGWVIGDDRMVTVRVPPETAVTVIRAGDITANGLRAEATFKSIGDGSVTVEDYDAPALHVASSKGPIALHRVIATQLEATASDGRVEGTALAVRDGTIESDGRVTLGFAAGTNAVVAAETSDGKVRVSGFSGGDLTAARHDDDDDDVSARTVRVGAGEGHIDVHSDGNINLFQS